MAEKREEKDRRKAERLAAKKWRAENPEAVARGEIGPYGAVGPDAEVDAYAPEVPDGEAITNERAEDGAASSG
jgi:hypothetical protein